MTLATLTLLLSLMPAAKTHAADLSGNWTIDGDVQGNPVGLTCSMQQTEAKLTGKCDVSGAGATELEGSVKDDTFKFSFTVMGYTLNYSGTVTGDAMTGDIEVSGANGKFSGKRS